ncbi:MAG: hypothetical protein J5719_04295 [Bacteroidales bacterium]|nr:hypothetical protein [Bacteroidales bacterium]
MKIRLLLISILTVTFFSCHHKQEVATTQEDTLPADTLEVVTEDEDTIPQGDVKLQQMANFLSGCPVAEDSYLYKFTQQAAWKNYAARANDLWQTFQTKKESYTTWAKSEIYPLSQNYTELFSPFSGSDFLYADIFFPNIETMYLFGLESVGSLPTTDSLKKNLGTYLETLHAAIGDIMKHSFFITRHMKTELSNVQVDGVAPLLLIFLTRSGQEILTMQYGSVDKEGHFFEVPYEQLNRHRNKLIKITYHQLNMPKVRTLYYTGGTNVANGSLKVNPEYIKFMNNMTDGCATFIKSASYLMHEEDFSMIRDVVLTKSDFIMQDDSGVPYRFFPADTWKTQLYGSYSRPIALFSEYAEADLAEAYKTADVKPLPFRIGYNRVSNERTHIRIQK